MGLIVYLSDFGPLEDPWFPLYWDMLVTGAFSLVIYYCAIAVSLPTEHIEENVREHVIPEEEEEVV